MKREHQQKPPRKLFDMSAPTSLHVTRVTSFSPHHQADRAGIRPKREIGREDESPKTYETCGTALLGSHGLMGTNHGC